MVPNIASIIVDDEASSRENISMLLKDFCPLVEVVGMVGDLPSAILEIRDKKPQLVFLDIRIGSETIFSMLSNLETINFEIIFITAYEHYALKAFEFMAVDYLMKPVDIPSFVKAVNNAIERISKKSIHVSMKEMMLHVENFNRTQHKMALATGKGYEMVYIKEIMYCIADGSYTHFHFMDERVLVVSKNLKYYENLLEEYDFIRSHNTSLVNLHFVKSIERVNGGSIIMEDGKNLPISKAKRQELDAQIKNKRRLI